MPGKVVEKHEHVQSDERFKVVIFDKKWIVMRNEVIIAHYFNYDILCNAVSNLATDS